MEFIQQAICVVFCFFFESRKCRMKVKRRVKTRKKIRSTQFLRFIQNLLPSASKKCSASPFCCFSSFNKNGSTCSHVAEIQLKWAGSVEKRNQTATLGWRWGCMITLLFSFPIFESTVDKRQHYSIGNSNWYYVRVEKL